MKADRSKILIEGLTPEELISLEDLQQYAVIGKPIIFNVGGAEVLADFSIERDILKVEIAVVEKGGEGVLPVLINVIEKSALSHGMSMIEWLIYARNCANPNPKLERVLTKLGFEVRELDTGSEIYWQRKSTNDTLLRRH